LHNKPVPADLSMEDFIVEEGEEEWDICSCFGIICYLFSFFILIDYFVSR
jgi:hypothetical protein